MVWILPHGNRILRRPSRCTHEFPKSGATAQGGFGDCPLRSRLLFRRPPSAFHHRLTDAPPRRPRGAEVGCHVAVKRRPAMVDDLNLLWGRVCRASRLYPNAAKIERYGCTGPVSSPIDRASPTTQPTAVLGLRGGSSFQGGRLRFQ
jgi:hypothetical protein